MSLPRFTLRYSNVVVALLLAALGVGIMQYINMPRRADPSFTIRMVQVITRWPGAQAVRVEEQISRVISDEVSRLEDVDFVTSTSRTGQSVLAVTLKDGVPTDEVRQVFDRIRAKVDEAATKLPQGAHKPVVNDDFGDTAIMLVALYEKQHIDASTGPPRYTPRQMEIIAERLQEQIALVDGVASAVMHGERTEAIYLEVDQGRWGNLALTIGELEDLLQARNITLAGGSIDTDRSRFGVQPTGEFDAVDQINSVIVDRDDVTGAPIYLEGVGIKARRGYQDPPTTIARFGNAQGDAPAIVIGCIMEDGANVITLGQQIKQLIADMQQKDKTLPPDIEATVVFDESKFVDFKISDFIVNVLQAILIVLVVAFIMAGWRASLIMAASIPFVMIISIGISAFMGIELEQMSIASLIIALGMLVDNAVVVTDNVTRQRNAGMGRFEGTAFGVEQIMYPILMGTLTTVFAFLPLAFFLSGNKAEYIFSIPAVVSTTLLTSWVLALTLSTLNAYWLIKPSKGGSSPLIWLTKRLGAIFKGKKQSEGAAKAPEKRDAFTALVSGCLAAKPLVIGVTVLVFIVAIMLPVGTDFFPNDNRDLLYIDVWMPEGSSFAATDDMTQRVESIMRRLSPDEAGSDRLKQYYASIGGSGPRFALGVSPQPPAANFAQIIAQTTSAQATDAYVADILQATKAELPGVRVVARKLSLGPPVDSPLGIRIFSSGYSQPGFADIGQLREQAERVKAAFRDLEGVWDVHDVWGAEGYELKVDVDEDRANLAGVTNASVANTLNAYYSGHRLTTFREGDHNVPVFLRLPPSERGELIDPRQIFVEGRAGKVPMDAVADVYPVRTTTRIERRDRNRMVEVRARVLPGYLANEKLTEAMPKLEEIEQSLPPGYYFEMGGTMEKSSESVTEMTKAFSFGVMLIILVLIWQYNSFVKPFAILATVPMGAIGAFFGLYVTGHPLGFMAMLGLVSLAGIVVNAGILYLEFADQLINERLAAGDSKPADGERSYNGLSKQAFRGCLAEASRQRFTPITLTVATTVGGLLPLALVGGPLWEAMAWLLIFGLIVATALTLLVLPAVYATFVEWFGLNIVKQPESANEEPPTEDASAVATT